MRFSLVPDLLRDHPTYRVGIVCVWDADVRSAQPGLREMLAEAAATLPRSLGGRRLDQHPAILAWERAFGTAGLNSKRHQPSVLALAERALRGEAVPSINTAVDIANTISLLYLVPVGAHDMDRLPGDVEVRPSRVGDTFTPMNADVPEEVPPGEPVYATGSEVRTRRWVWRQSERAKVTPDSRTILFPLDGFTDLTAGELATATHELALMVQDHLGGRVTMAFVDAQTPSVELTRETATGVQDLESLPESVPSSPDHEHHPGELQEALGQLLAPSPQPSPSGRRQGEGAIGEPLPSAKSQLETALREWSLSDLLRRGLLEGVIVEEELRRDLASGKRLAIYQGFDPTSPNLHLGHYVSLRVLRWFQLHRHRVIFLIGDFTGRIGDPTDRSAARQQLTHEQVLENAGTYRAQIARVLDFGGDNPVEVLFNGAWLDPLSLRDVVQLAASVTVQRLIERDMFQERMREGKPLHLHEALYPLLQGYDSVAMGVDAELGGRDQMFNMLVGRDLVRTYLGKTKHVLMTPLIPGLDGRKMSKTYGNTVDLTEGAVPMFFKLTLVDDQLLPLFLSVFTDAPDEEIAAVRERLGRETNLQDVRERFAREVTTTFHGEEAAARAQEEFRQVVSEGVLPTDIPTVELPSRPPQGPSPEAM